MDYKEMNEALANLDQAIIRREELLEESEGEITATILELEDSIAVLQEVLTTEGVDLLGRWLKAKEDKKKALKAEKDYITRQMASIDETIDFIKVKVNQVLTAAGEEKVKGSLGYSFKATTSVTTSVDKEVLKANYQVKIDDLLRQAEIPDYIGFTLTASSTKANEVGIAQGDEELFITTQKETCTFTKPRANKE